MGGRGGGARHVVTVIVFRVRAYAGVNVGAEDAWERVGWTQLLVEEGR